MNTNGYFPLQRSLLATDFWRTQSRTSPTAALVELFALARYGQRATTVLMGRRRIRVFRGEIVASLRFLADRWKWSVGRVRYFLSKLHDQGVLHLSTRQRITVITLLKPARPLGPADLDPAAPGLDLGLAAPGPDGPAPADLSASPADLSPAAPGLAGPDSNAVQATPARGASASPAPAPAPAAPAVENPHFSTQISTPNGTPASDEKPAPKSLAPSAKPAPPAAAPEPPFGTPFSTPFGTNKKKEKRTEQTDRNLSSFEAKDTPAQARKAPAFSRKAAAPAATRPSRFAAAPPTLDELVHYCRTQGLTAVPVSRFRDYYQARGWLMGNTPMRDWQAALRLWNRTQTIINPQNIQKHEKPGKHSRSLPAGTAQQPLRPAPSPARHGARTALERSALEAIDHLAVQQAWRIAGLV